MSCPHSLKSGPCSQCIADAPVRVVTLEGASLLIDGQPAGRGLDRSTPLQTHYARRGGKAHGRRRQE